VKETAKMRKIEKSVNQRNNVKKKKREYITGIQALTLHQESLI